MKKILAIFLSVLTLFSFTACGKKENEEILLLNNGYSRYKIVLSTDAIPYETMAANELQYFIKEATGYEFDIITEDKLSENECYISIGHTEKLAESKIEFNNDELGRSGYKIVTDKDENVYLFGGDNDEGCGTVYSVYKFLNDTVGYVYYSDLNIYFEEKQDVYMPTYDIIEKPTFDARLINTLKATSDADYSMRMRFTPRIISTTVRGHSHFTIIDPDIYFENHPDWFNETITQLCLSNEEMIEEFVKNLIEFMKKEPEAKEVMLTLMDNYEGCECPTCTANLEKYGTYGGINVVFMNKVAEKCDAWFEENQPGRKMVYYTYAYYATEEAPTIEVTDKDGNVTYAPIHEDVVCRDNVQIQCAFINMNRNKPLDYEESLYYYHTLLKWSVVCKNLRSYTYLSSYNLQGYMYSLNDFDTVERNVKIFAANNVVNAYYVFGYDVTNVCGLYDMKAYCISQLMWNSELHYADLAKDFMEKSYLEAEPYMWEYYQVYRTWMTNYEETITADTSFPVIYGAKLLPKALIDKLYSLIEKSYTAIDIYKEIDKDLYDLLVSRIEKEEVMPLYAYLSIYWDSFNQNQRAEMIDRLEFLTNKFDYRYFAENKTMHSQISAFKTKNK